MAGAYPTLLPLAGVKYGMYPYNCLKRVNYTETVGITALSRVIIWKVSAYKLLAGFISRLGYGLDWDTEPCCLPGFNDIG